jgi:hypothetical protein
MLAICLSVNIHDRFSGVDAREYSQHCMDTYLKNLLKPFQRETQQTSLCILVAESTVFRENSQKSKIRVRGGHILAAEVIAPALTLLLTDRVANTNNKILINSLYNAVFELHMNASPLLMLAFGHQIRENFRETITEKAKLASTNVYPDATSSSSGRKS